MATNYFWKVSMLRGAAICVVDCINKVSWVHAGQGGYTVILLVSPLVSFTNTKIYRPGWVLLCCHSLSALYVYYFRTSCPWTSYVNLTILWRNGYACASIRYQAISLLPCDLGTRLIPTVALFPGCHPASCQLQYPYCKWWEAGWWPGVGATQAATISVSCSQAIEYMCLCLSIER